MRIGWVVLAACGSPPAPAHPMPDDAPLSSAADARMLTIAAGRYIAGSTPEERATAYDDHEHSGGTDDARTNGWFDKEADRHLAELAAFRLDVMPVTNAAYHEFVVAGHAPPPAIDEAAWTAQGFNQDYATEVVRYIWKDGRPPATREDHPVVLVTHDEAKRYCAWRGKRRLPTSAEYEKAARGPEGRAYPWGNAFEAGKLNSAVNGLRDTMPVGSFTDGGSLYGVLDLAGNVFQWTSTPMPGQPGRMIVKGSAWEDFAGLGRGASQHGRPATARHVIVGFRCAAD